MGFEQSSSTFQSRFNFKVLFKRTLYIQVLFKPVGTLLKDFKMAAMVANLEIRTELLY